jgi:hypothetical protein
LRALILAMLKASRTGAGEWILGASASQCRQARAHPSDRCTGGRRHFRRTGAVEVAASRADVDGAIAGLGDLDGAVRAPAQDWIGKARARQAALAAARELAAETARALGKR